MFPKKAHAHVPGPSMGSVEVPQYLLGARGKPNGQALLPYQAPQLPSVLYVRNLCESLEKQGSVTSEFLP